MEINKEVCKGDLNDVREVHPTKEEIPDWCPLDGPNDL
jgi:hypothetical protein